MRFSLITVARKCLRLLCQPIIRLLRNCTRSDNKSLTSSVAADVTRSRLDLRESLDHFLILGERHLHRIVKEYVAYFNHARPHQSIKQRIPCQPEPLSKTGRIPSYPVLGGLHHDYRRKAA